MLTDTISPGSLKSEDEHRRDLCTAGRWLHQRGFVPATDGNISLRLDARRILASPTGCCKGLLTPDDLVVTDLDGRKLNGRPNPSSELDMHLLIYRRRPDINAVCHAHPPAATGYAAAGRPLDKALVTEVIIGLGPVPVAPFAIPGTRELSDSIEPLVQRYDAILMANHGVVTYGCDLLTAFFRMETTEHFARVTLVTELIGKQVLLSAANVEKLLAARQRYGMSAPGPATPRPVSAEDASGQQVTLTQRELEALIAEAVRRDRSRET
jgi:L-fuculose-phosphate aldolase